jgi:hypothetical protein
MEIISTFKKCGVLREISPHYRNAIPIPAFSDVILV